MRSTVWVLLTLAFVGLSSAPRARADGIHDFDKHWDSDAAPSYRFDSDDHLLFAEFEHHFKSRKESWGWLNSNGNQSNTVTLSGITQFSSTLGDNDGDPDDRVSTPEPSALTLLLVGFVGLLGLNSLRKVIE